MAMTGGTSKLVKTSTLGDTSATCKLYVYYKTSQDVATNKSTVTCGMYIVVSSGYYIGSWSDTGGSYVGTTSLTFSGAIPSSTSGTYWLVENKKFTVTHDDEGKATATIKWKWGVNSSWGGMVMPSGSFTITLPTIARASTFSATNANIGSATTITINRKSDSFTHSFQYMIDGQSSYTTIVSKTTAASSYKWTIPDEAYKYISSAKVKIYIKCRTYSGDTKIGESIITITATATAASTVSATNASIGNATTISITRKSSKLTHTLQYKIGSQSSYTTIVSKTTSTSYKWTIPESAYSYISSGSVSVSIKCITYSDSTKIGEKTTTFTASAKAASTVSATSVNIGAKPTITITRNSSSFKHTLQYKISGEDAYTTIVSKTSSTSYSSWAIPEDDAYKQCKSAKSVKVTIKCITYYSDVKIGETTTSLTASCVESVCKPTLNPTIKDTGSVSKVLTGDADNTVIKEYNIMDYSIGATANKGASIKSQKITCGSKSATTASGQLSYVTSNKFTISATDSRGYTTSTTVTKSKLINYVKLTCNITATAKLATDSNGNSTTTLTITANGNWFNGSFGAKTNTITVQYKVSGGTTVNWTNITATKSGNTYTATKTITGLDYTKTYTVQVRAWDALHDNGASDAIKTSPSKTVSAKPIFDWDKDDFSFNVNVVMDSNTRIYGKKADGSAWVQALEPCNANNNLTLGFGGYDASLGNTNVYGNSVNVNSKNNINLNSPVKLVKDTYSSACAMDCQNSDIWGVNGIIFADKCSGVSEGIKFPTDDSSGTYDRLAAFDGNLYFYPKDSSTGYALFYTAGMKYTLNGAITFWGHLTTSSTEIFAFIPTSRRILASNVSVSGKIIMRGVSGYLYNPKDTSTNVINLSSPSGFTKTVAVKDGGIYLKLTFDDKILNGNGNTYTNNTPVIFCNTGGDVVFTFS